MIPLIILPLVPAKTIALVRYGPIQGVQQKLNKKPNKLYIQHTFYFP